MQGNLLNRVQVWLVSWAEGCGQDGSWAGPSLRVSWSLEDMKDYASHPAKGGSSQVSCH